MTTMRSGRAEEVRHVEFRASDNSDGRTLEGYAAVFNQWTTIRDSMGEFKERIAPGAFKRTLGQRTPVLQFDHGSHPLIGSLPLGAITALREDRNGLFVRARLADNWLIQPVRDAIADGAISGMSFRFRVVADEWGTEDGVDARTIKEVELLELGPVVFPAYEQTTVAVRSLVGALDDETRAVLARELAPTIDTDDVGPAAEDEQDDEINGTSDVASEPANTDDGPDEPPVASHDTPRQRIVAALTRAGHHITKETTDVPE